MGGLLQYTVQNLDKLNLRNEGTNCIKTDFIYL